MEVKKQNKNLSVWQVRKFETGRHISQDQNQYSLYEYPVSQHGKELAQKHKQELQEKNKTFISFHPISLKKGDGM